MNEIVGLSAPHTGAIAHLELSVDRLNRVIRPESRRMVHSEQILIRSGRGNTPIGIAELARHGPPGLLHE